MGLFDIFKKKDGTSGATTTAQDDEFYEKMAELVKASYTMYIIGEMSGGRTDPAAVNAMHQAYGSAHARYGAAGTKKLYAICMEQNPGMEPFLKKYFN